MKTPAEDCKAPWKDFEGNDIYLGDTLRHPDGTTFKVVRDNTYTETWRCDYGSPHKYTVALCLQVGSRGQAVVISSTVLPARPARTVTGRIPTMPQIQQFPGEEAAIAKAAQLGMTKTNMRMMLAMNGINLVEIDEEERLALTDALGSLLECSDVEHEVSLKALIQKLEVL